ncbi:MAG: dUTP diphosphatase [Oscillospiraceae bacterium]|nr:dUTP diphosphatase [Oscillospiraceae bacterium]MDY3066208.1 dUTP diphosphatase [Oscillospiraceae bacterium]
MDTLSVKRLTDTARLPMRQTPGSAGYDLYADVEELTIQPGEICRIPTGIAIAIGDIHAAAFIYARSGIASKFGVSPANCVGVIDSDYRGEIQVPLMNHGKEPFVIRRGDRIAQLLFAPVFLPELLECESLDETARGAGGFGSTAR